MPRFSRSSGLRCLVLGFLIALGTQGCGNDADDRYDDLPSDDEAAPAYSLEVAVTDSSSPLGALQFEITHLGNSGGFIGRDDQVECMPLVEAIVAANSIGGRTAKIGMISLQGIRTPALILRCGFRTREVLGPASFLVEVTDASDTNSAALDPPPTVAIESVTRRCSDCLPPAGGGD